MHMIQYKAINKNMRLKRPLHLKTYETGIIDRTGE